MADAYSSPFSDPSIAEATNEITEYNPFEQHQASSYSVYESLPDNNNTQNEPKKPPERDRKSVVIKEQQLLQKEKELEEREKMLEMRELQVQSAQATNANWPFSCCPVTYHDISAEIPQKFQGLVKYFYILVLFTGICFLLNWLSILSLWFAGYTNEDTDALWSTVYFFCGILGSWKLWYRNLYYGIRDHLTRKWLFFFFWLAAHCIFVAVMIVGIEGFGGSGIFKLINAFSLEYQKTGTFITIVFICWSLNLVVSIFLLKKAHSSYQIREGTEQPPSSITDDAHKEVKEQMIRYASESAV